MSAPRKLAPTNLSLEDLRMDDRGIKDSRYYCLPPNRTRGERSGPHGGRYPFHLVSQGNLVGYFDNWAEAKASLSGYPDNSNQGCFSEEECIDVWQRLCLLGVHPHPVDPAAFDPPSASAAAFVNISPRQSARARGSPRPKQEIRDPVGKSPTKTELLADLPILPTAGPSQTPRRSRREATPGVNFAIGGSGIISSSAERTEQRYRDMQRRGEEPDLLITRNFARATLFAIDDEESEGEGS